MGDRSSEQEFAAFCHAQHPRLVGALTLYTGDHSTARDLAQETLARVWRDWRRIGAMESAPGYAYKAALNLAKNHFRRREVRRRYAHLVGVRDEHTDPDGAEAVAVREALAGLPQRRRAALVLRYFADLSVAETAQVMGIPQNTVKTLTRRALQALRDELAVDVEEGQPHAR